MEPKRRWGYCFHSIIKYAEVFPDTIQHIKNTVEYIWECFLQYRWIKADAKPNDFFFLGKQCRFHVSSIVCKTWSRWTSIINISSMYCFTNIKSGLFDIREYDVTEFHRLINYRQEKKRIESHHIKESLWLQMHLQRSVSNPELVHFILDRKWLYTGLFCSYGLWYISHSCLFTVSMMEKSRLLFCTQNNGELLHKS